MSGARSLWTSVLVAIAVGGTSAQQWPHYAGDQAASHYSPLEQITPANVGKLAIAWEWKPNEKVLPQFGTRPGAFQNTPLVIDAGTDHIHLIVPPDSPSGSGTANR